MIQGKERTFKDLEVFELGDLTKGWAVEIIPANWWVIEKANYGYFAVSPSVAHAYRFIERKGWLFARVAQWPYQPYYGVDYNPDEPLKISGIWLTPNDAITESEPFEVNAGEVAA